MVISMTINERITLPVWKKLILFIVSFVLFCIQIFLIFTLFDVILIFSNSELKLVYIFTEVLGIVMTLYVLSTSVSTNFKLTWSILFLLAPLPFVVLFFINEVTKYYAKKKIKKINSLNLKIQPNKEPTPNDRNLLSLYKVCNQDKNATISNGTKYKFYSNCLEKHNDMIIELQQAKHYIFMEYFIIEDGQLMEEVFHVLEQKGKEGVQIKILYDDIGSKKAMTRKLLKKLATIPNCRVNNYEPTFLNLSILVNYRDHRKITIIDGNVCYCGGDNLADEYIHKKERFGYWRDNCGKFEGSAVVGFLNMFCQMWYMSTKEKITDIYLPKYKEHNENQIIVFGDGPTNDKNIAYDVFMSLISNAKESICISTPYFIIDDAMINSIVLKIKEGIDVKILLPKIPDKKSVFYMSRNNYKKILESGGKIYEYTPGFNHAKNIIVDKKQAFIGTINMDYRSMFLHYECGAIIVNDLEIEKMYDDFVEDINKSELIGYDKWCSRPLYQKIIAFVLNLFSTLF